MGEGAHILVDGATGYLGTHLTRKLLDSGFNVNCLVHPGAKRQDMEELQRLGAEVFIGTLNQADATGPVLRKAFKNAIAAVHLIGSVAPKKGQSVEEMHAGQTHWFMHHVKEQRVSRTVIVTTLGTASDAKTSYQKTKWAAEQIVSSANVPYTILRPSLIIGRTVGHRDSKLVKRYMEIINSKKFVPLIGGGNNKVEPVFVDDLVKAICRCIFPGKWQREATNKELEIGGPEVLKMREFVEMLMDAIGVHKPIIGVPSAIAYAAALYCENYQEVPTVSQDQVKLSLSDNVCTHNALNAELGIEPTAVKVALQTYANKKDTVAMGAQG
jgi:NADH dehydrogenase